MKKSIILIYKTCINYMYNILLKLKDNKSSNNKNKQKREFKEPETDDILL